MFAQELPPGRAEGSAKRELAAWVPTAGNHLEMASHRYRRRNAGSTACAPSARRNQWSIS
jgi:hypothetical protein